MFDSIDGGPARDGGSVLMGGVDDRGDDLVRSEGADGVVDQHDVFRISGDVCECAGDRILPMLTTLDKMQRLG